MKSFGKNESSTSRFDPVMSSTNKSGKYNLVLLLVASAIANLQKTLCNKNTMFYCSELFYTFSCNLSKYSQVNRYFRMLGQLSRQQLLTEHNRFFTFVLMKKTDKLYNTFCCLLVAFAQLFLAK